VVTVQMYSTSGTGDDVVIHSAAMLGMAAMQGHAVEEYGLVKGRAMSCSDGYRRNEMKWFA
jgi:hypothetical protein